MSTKLLSISPYGQRNPRPASTHFPRKSHPERSKDPFLPILLQAATVNGTVLGILKNLSYIETPDQLEETAEAISDFQIFKKKSCSFQSLSRRAKHAEFAGFFR